MPLVFDGIEFIESNKTFRKEFQDGLPTKLGVRNAIFEERWNGVLTPVWHVTVVGNGRK